MFPTYSVVTGKESAGGTAAGFKERGLTVVSDEVVFESTDAHNTQQIDRDHKLSAVMANHIIVDKILPSNRCSFIVVSSVLVVTGDAELSPRGNNFTSR